MSNAANKHEPSASQPHPRGTERKPATDTRQTDRSRHDVATRENSGEAAEHITTLHELMFPAAGQCIRVAAELNLADQLADGPLPVTELAARTGSKAGALRMALHILADDDIFTEVEPDVWANTPRSELLRAGVANSQHTMAQFAGADWLWACYAQLSRSVSTGEAAFDEIYGTNLWAWMGRNPLKGKQFNDAMNEFSATVGPSIARSYPRFGEAGVVADLGGGQGTFLANILSAYPSVSRGVLVDQPSVIEQARTNPDLAELDGRIDFFPGDFFADVPTGVDLYTCKQITHSWNDERLVALLKRCRDASPNARVAAAELVARPGVSRFVRNFDLIMLVTMAGFLRTDEDFANVFAQAGYRLERVVPTDTAFSIIEAVPAD